MENVVLDYTFDQYKKHYALIGKEINFSQLIEFFNKQLASIKQNFHQHKRKNYNQLDGEKQGFH
jgi:hypothetical protein